MMRIFSFCSYKKRMELSNMEFFKKVSCIIFFTLFLKNYSKDFIRTVTFYNKTDTTIHLCSTTLSPVNFLETHDALLGDHIVLEPHKNQVYSLDNRSKSIAIHTPSSLQCWTLPIPESNQATVFFLPIGEFALTEGQEE